MLHKPSLMAQWMIPLLSLFGSLHGEESILTSIQKCCQSGRARALDGHDCAILPSVPTHMCSVVQEQCCRSAVIDKFCCTGIKMAKEQGACERPYFQGDHLETKISKMCCDCCELGLLAARHGLSCELHSLLLPRQCSYAAKTCCRNNTKEENKPAAAAPVKPEVVTAGSNTCKNSNCSQLCLGDDKCGCYGGFQLRRDGVSCEDVDECRTGNVCGVHGCVNLLGSYRCECKAGFNFNSITKLCEDINECLTNSHNCISGQACINTEGSFRCQRATSCGTGYELTANNICRDIDECALGTHNCGPDFICTNTEGSFRCRPKDKCGDGYIQDAIGSCIDINECVVHHNLCPHRQTCINTVGSYTCRSDTVTCGQGYHLTEDSSRCEDVDECRTGNVCGVHGCVNLLGSYRCECKAGYNFNSITKLCEDINECLHYPGRLCAHKCENTEGSYKCSCTSGFKLSYDGKSCEDVNECEAKPCSQECVNFYGSYQCYCRRGYQLSDIDGKTCEDIDECATGGHSCSYHCFNTPGSFNCTCPPSGYTLANDWRTCQDIDECAAGTHTCSVSQSCFNVLGGYRCLAFQCPPNFRQAASGSRADASATVRCIKSCQPHDINCAHQFVSLITHSAISLPTLKGSTEPQEIILLRTTVPAAPLPNATDVSFVILGAENRVFFDVVQRSDNGVILGVVRQVKPIFGPSDLVLEVSMNYVNSEGIPQSSVIIIHVFISEFSF
ncbi:fibulin-1-like isoform X5 [Acanthochromis polyacanthus]|uniref:fibulin-1-like isoform X4 n=1 Tax=Acanthochromis polyacanthus TaxID=80966 RepID=UPI002233F934|nr:fibulin-1-like isoform X4 [Acanthochromis polyacanthus]XP_051812744.1 fibulin-1-like isoform X5 [Acanthochromis polyacanthus]